MIKINVTQPPVKSTPPIYPRLVLHTSGTNQIYLMFKEKGPSNAIGLTEDCYGGLGSLTSIADCYVSDFVGSIIITNDR